MLMHAKNGCRAQKQEVLSLFHMLHKNEDFKAISSLVMRCMCHITQESKQQFMELRYPWRKAKFHQTIFTQKIMCTFLGQ